MDPALEVKVQHIRAEIRAEYLSDDEHPWIVGFSGGKDSTLVAHLVFDEILSPAPHERRRFLTWSSRVADRLQNLQVLVCAALLCCSVTFAHAQPVSPATLCSSRQALAILPRGESIACRAWQPGAEGVAGYAWEAPHARAIVLIQHGYGDYALRYVSGNDQLISSLLALGISVYAFDMRGNGYSSGKRGVVDVEQAIQDHLAARRALRAQPLPVFLLGHSLGGLVAVSSALRDQTDIAGLILLAPAIRYHVPAPLRWVTYAGATLFPSAAVPESKGDVGELVADASSANALQADPMFYRGPLRFLTAAGGLRQSRRNWSAYHALRIPLLAIHGTADTSTDPAGSRELVDVVDSLDKTFISVQGGHHALLDDTSRDDVRAAILAWINARISPSTIP